MRRLADYSTEALLRELAFRRDGLTELRPIRRWCHDCTHWRYSKGDGDTANNCTKGNEMDFRMPEGYPDGEEWGFYKRGCRDWCAAPPLPPPTAHNPFPSSPPPPPRPAPGSRPRRAT